MKIKFLSIALLPVLIAACTQSNRPSLAPEYMFDSKGMQVITSSFNTQQQTMSTLYGNAAALRAAAADSAQHFPGEEYTLVTWKQQPHPYWFGSNLSEALTTIERVSSIAVDTGHVQFNYEVLKENAAGSPTTISDQQQRIEYILHQKRSEFPE